MNETKINLHKKKFTEHQNLHNLINCVGLKPPSGLPNSGITDISSDSRSVRHGSLFFGLQGNRVDGGTLWPEALQAGAAAAIIGNSAALLKPPAPNDPVLVLPDPIDEWLGEFASAFWEKPSSKLNLIGITGTNGKTTITHLIEHLSAALGCRTALFGTLVNRWPGNSSASTLTTNFADKLQAELAAAVRSGVTLCAMEVSSHALVQKRVAGCYFSGAIFTNLTQDHLDYHSSMKDYFEAKCQLFQPDLLKSKTPSSIINVDDSWGLLLAERLGGKCWRSSLSTQYKYSSHIDLSLADIKFSENGIEGRLISPCGEGNFISPLVGEFNLMNFLQAVGVLLQHGFPLQGLLDAITDFHGVPGRMERIRVRGEKSELLPLVVVDYAHTPDGLKNALAASRSFVKGKLICVFGCGGDRDRSKRSQMGLIAAELADHLVVTSDNPRTEDPERIVKDILEGIPAKASKVVELDRGQAICKAIDDAQFGDVVLVAGKGHEDYQILGTEKIVFDDREVVRNILLKKINSY